MNNLFFDPIHHIYTLNGLRVRSVTQILQEAGLVDYSHVPAMVLEAARKFGTAVHKATELYDLDNLDESILDNALRPYLDGWKKFRKDTGVIIEAVEEMVCSEKYRFAGKPDRRVILDKRGILDIKTSFEMLPAVRLQTAGYELAYNEGRAVKDKSHRRLAVLLNDDGGGYKIEEYRNKNDANIFLAALTICNFKGGLI